MLMSSAVPNPTQVGPCQAGAKGWTRPVYALVHERARGRPLGSMRLCSPSHASIALLRCAVVARRGIQNAVALDEVERAVPRGGHRADRGDGHLPRARESAFAAPRGGARWLARARAGCRAVRGGGLRERSLAGRPHRRRRYLVPAGRHRRGRRGGSRRATVLPLLRGSQSRLDSSTPQPRHTTPVDSCSPGPAFRAVGSFLTGYSPSAPNLPRRRRESRPAPKFVAIRQVFVHQTEAVAGKKCRRSRSSRIVPESNVKGLSPRWTRNSI